MTILPSLVTFLWLVAPSWGQAPLLEGNTEIRNVAGHPDANAGWMDSYSIGNRCYCESTYPNNIGRIMVPTPLGRMSTRTICEIVGRGPGSEGHPKYNDIQCGNGPLSAIENEAPCPGRVDHGPEGCGYIGPKWSFAAFLPEAPPERPPPPEGFEVVPTPPPTPQPTFATVTNSPTTSPTSEPLKKDITNGPTMPPTLVPAKGTSAPSSTSSIGTSAPVASSTAVPAPVSVVTTQPSISPAPSVSTEPSSVPSDMPSQFPTLSDMPTSVPSDMPSLSPSKIE